MIMSEAIAVRLAVTCGTCSGLIVRVGGAPCDRAAVDLPAWVHDAGQQDHAATPAVTVTRVWRDGLSWQHAVSITTGDGSYCARISDGAVTWADAHVWADPAAYGLERVTCPGHGGAVCQYGACDYIRPAGLDLGGLAATFEAGTA